MNRNEQLEADLWNKNFCWEPRLWWAFFGSGFFFRCLYSVIYGAVYIIIHSKKLNVDTIVGEEDEEIRFSRMLGLANSTIVYPVNDYSYFHQLANSLYVGQARIIGKTGLSVSSLNDFLSDKNIENNSYDVIVISCLQQDVITKSLTPDSFESEVEKVFCLLRQKLTPGGIILHLYGDYSFHPTVPRNNYFQDYFKYKTERFLDIMRKHMSDNDYIVEVMNLEGVDKKKAWSYIHADAMHFSQVGQNELYRDLVKGMKEYGLL